MCGLCVTATSNASTPTRSASPRCVWGPVATVRKPKSTTPRGLFPANRLAQNNPRGVVDFGFLTVATGPQTHRGDADRVGVDALDVAVTQSPHIQLHLCS